jgi:hypothetical protein
MSTLFQPEVTYWNKQAATGPLFQAAGLSWVLFEPWDAVGRNLATGGESGVSRVV